MPLHVAPQQASERMAVLSRKGDLGGMFVHVCRLQYEPQLVQRSGIGKLEHLLQVQSTTLPGTRCTGSGTLLQQHLSVAFNPCKSRMTFLDNGQRPVAPSSHLHLDVEDIAATLFQPYFDGCLLHIAAPLLHIRRSHVAQHLEAVLRLSEQRSQRHGNRKPYHAVRTGNAHAHRILEHVGAQQYGDTFGPAAEHFRRTRRTKRYGNRFRTPYRRHYLPVHQGYYRTAFRR